MEEIRNEENSMVLQQIYEDAVRATLEVVEASGLEKGDIMVVGCSTSEVTGNTIGSASSVDAAQMVFKGIYEILYERGIYLAAQCCEHLNRAIVIERELAKETGIPVVNVIPQPKAGGSFATMAYKHFKSPVVVEHIKADAGMDIGDTLIGMHLKEVAVPLRINTQSIGAAHLVCARTRGKFIGGSRACYDEAMM